MIILLGIIGNKTETSAYTIIFLIYSVITLFGYLYFLSIQTYVLKFEVIINLIGIFFLIIEIIFAFIATFVFVLHEKTL